MSPRHRGRHDVGERLDAGQSSTRARTQDGWRAAASTECESAIAAPMPPRRPRVLWIDEGVSREDAAVHGLRIAGFDVACGNAGIDAAAGAALAWCDVVLIGPRLARQPGLRLLHEVVAAGVGAPIVMLTWFAEVEIAVTAMKLGAADYIKAPEEPATLAAVLRDVAARRGQRRRDVAEPGGGMDWLLRYRTRLAGCRTRTALAIVMIEGLLDPSATLAAFASGADALRLAMQDERTVHLLAEEMGRILTESAARPLPQHPKLRQALLLIERGRSRQALRTLPERVGLSRRYLGRLILETTGRRAVDWCRSAIMRAAVRQVCESTEAISQIAYAVGFEHVGQFDRDFHQTFGQAPGRLRQMVLAGRDGTAVT